MEYSIDRFEEEQAVLIDSAGEKKIVLKTQLPEDVAEGDMLLFDGEKYQKNQTLTDQRRAEAKRLINKLFK